MPGGAVADDRRPGGTVTAMYPPPLFHPVDLVVRGRVLEGGRLLKRSVGVLDGRIARIGRRLGGDRVVDVGERVLLPGATDLHVHFRDPGHPGKEDFGTGTLAAAHGGVTCVLDMPNTDPPTTTLDRLRAKRKAAEAKAHVDFGLYAGLTDDPASAALLREATSMKAYLGATTGDLLVGNADAVRAALRESAATGKLLAFHAESDACLHHHGARVRHRHDPAVWSAARPAECEANAVSFIRENMVPGARAHLAHLSTRRGLDAAEGVALTKEVTPHHLFATVQDLAGDVRWKMNPPLRAKADQAALWAALRDGRIDCVASDHAPHLPAEKEADVWQAPAGVPGVETMLPLLLAATRRRRLALARAVEVLCEAPARIAGLPKGRLAPGYDADLVAVDLRDVRPVRAEDLHSRCGWTPYEGMEAVFPTHVWVRGEPAVADGATAGRPGLGRFQAGGRTPPRGSLNS